MNLAFDVVANTLVIVHAKQPPTDAEWARIIERFPARDFRCQLCWTDGGSPNARQRGLLREASGDNHPPLALLTEDAVARGVMSILGLFFKHLKAFKQSQLEAACDYLQLPKPDRPAVLATLERLRAELRGANRLSERPAPRV